VGFLFTFKQLPSNCENYHYFECQCLKSLTQFRKIKRTMRTINTWRKRIAEITEMEEFQYRDDIEINLIKFTMDMRLAETRNNITDYTLLSIDCIHLSQKGQSYFAMNLWNQMLTKENVRPTATNFNYEDFKCPTYENPNKKELNKIIFFKYVSMLFAQYYRFH